MPSTLSELPELPEEVIEEIMYFGYNDRSNVPSLRYTCSTLYYKTDHWFRRFYLQEIPLKLTPRDLDLLTGVAGTPHFAGSVKELRIQNGRDRRIENDRDREIDAPYPMVRYEKQPSEPFPEDLARMESLLKDNFINCDTISLTSAILVFIDGRPGMTAAALPSPDRVLALSPTLTTYNNSFEYYILALKTMIKLNRPINSSRILFLGGDMASEYTNYPIDDSFFRTEESRVLWSTLKNLEIVFDVRLVVKPWIGDLDPMFPGWYLAILTNASSLKSLSLRFLGDPNGRYIQTPMVSEYYLNNVKQLPLLSKLHITNMCVSQRFFDYILLQLGPTLHDLCLSKMRVWEKVPSWIPFMKSLGEKAPHLHRLKLNLLRERSWATTKFPPILERCHSWLAAGGVLTNSKSDQVRKSLIVSSKLKIFLVSSSDDLDGSSVCGFHVRGPELQSLLADVRGAIQEDLYPRRANPNYYSIPE